MADRWITLSAVKDNISPASYTRYKGIVENHLIPAPLSATLLQKLRGSTIEEYYASIPVGSRAVHHTVLRRALRKAVKDQLLAKNPIADIDSVPRRRRPKNADARINCWTASEAKAF